MWLRFILKDKETRLLWKINRNNFVFLLYYH